MGLFKKKIEGKTAEEWNYLGAELYDSGKPREMIGCCDKALSISKPGSADAIDAETLNGMAKKQIRALEKKGKGAWVWDPCKREWYDKEKRLKAKHAPTVAWVLPGEEIPTSMTRADIKRKAKRLPDGWMMEGRYDIDFITLESEEREHAPTFYLGGSTWRDWIYFRSVDNLNEVEAAISTCTEMAESVLSEGGLSWGVMKFRVVDSKSGRVLKFTKPIEVRV